YRSRLARSRKTGAGADAAGRRRRRSAQRNSHSNQRSNLVKAVYTELHRSHDPQFFLVRGVVQRTTEQPERADRLLAGLKADKHDLVAPTVFGQGPRARIHSPEYLGFLAEAW